MDTTEKILQTMSSWHWGELIIEGSRQGFWGSSRSNGYDYQQWKASTVLWHRFKSQKEAAVKDSHSSGCQPLSNIGHSSASEIRPSLSVSKISKHSSSAAAVGSCSLCCEPISCRYSLKQTLCSVWSAEMLPAILLALSSDAEMVLAITASSHLRVDVSLWYSH